MNAVITPRAFNFPASKVREDERQYEIINGLRVLRPPMSVLACRVVSRLLGWLGPFCRDRNLGEAVAGMLFHLPLPQDRNRRPDLAFVSAEHIAQAPAQSVEDDVWAVVPDLAVEVLSPSDLAEDVLEKIGEYFQAGVQLVWVVSPQRRIIYVYESPTQTRVMTSAGELDGGSVLSGFRLSLANLY